MKSENPDQTQADEDAGGGGGIGGDSHCPPSASQDPPKEHHDQKSHQNHTQENKAVGENFSSRAKSVEQWSRRDNQINYKNKEIAQVKMQTAVREGEYHVSQEIANQIQEIGSSDSSTPPYGQTSRLLIKQKYREEIKKEDGSSPSQVFRQLRHHSNAGAGQPDSLLNSLSSGAGGVTSQVLVGAAGGHLPPLSSH